MADQGNALVVWGSTGRRLQFTMQDLKMPESLRSDPHVHFYEKQWDAVAGFWFNRVLKESSLQHLEVERIVELIREDIAKRWEKRRLEQSLHKKRKRLLQGSGPAGPPSRSVLLTNVIALERYEGASEAEKKELLEAVVERVEAVSKDTVLSWQVLVDRTAAPAPAEQQSDREENEEPPAKKGKAEDRSGATAAAPETFDDRVAFVCAVSSREKAATAVAHLHGSKFDGRRVLCRFWEAPP